ncbi:hypothetical protein WJX73_005402 [Symbiochloris irregularis]|uniref:Acetyl-coenzyme A synthetase n=1 Tax=Symbiochloris irregularis TaxID=706552 RepID=A0AAW1NRW8_9CHLO
MVENKSAQRYAEGVHGTMVLALHCLARLTLPKGCIPLQQRFGAFSKRLPLFMLCTSAQCLPLHTRTGSPSCLSLHPHCALSAHRTAGTRSFLSRAWELSEQPLKKLVRRPLRLRLEAGAHEPMEPVSTPYQHSLLKDRSQYDAEWRRSVEDPAGFWGDMASNYHWEQQFETNHQSENFDVRKGKIFQKWFRGGKTNLTYNCLDRHIERGLGDSPALLWEGNEPGTDKVLTYKQVHAAVCQLANWLKANGITKGDAVAIYLPMLPELPIAMLACARIGAVHSVIFGGFSSDALASRVKNCEAKVVITATGGMRGKKAIPLKRIVDKGLAKVSGLVSKVLVYKNPDVPECDWTDGRDVWWQDELASQSTDCAVEWVESEHPLFTLYTSGSTGQPKGVLHTTGGYMLMAGTTTRYVFDLQPGDVYWCTADCGWITGHTYLTYGPLLNGAASVVFEGQPTYPDAGRVWAIVQKYKVKQLYTAPTLIRALINAGDQWVTKYDRSSLAILGTVGEPINPIAWQWYHEVVGEGRCPIVDTYWQTETGAHIITPLPGVWPQPPGCASLPFFGVQPVMLNEKGEELQGAGEGFLAVKASWPSTLRTLFGDHARYETTYFQPFKGYYFTGDGTRRDKEGRYWITGRVDDVINVSGHRIGTAEVEAALTEHPGCSEAAVVGIEHAVKGQGLYAYITLKEGHEYTDALKKELVNIVRSQIGAFAAPDVIHWAPGLPKTRSGKIMRRVLRKIAAKEESELGDTSTLADPAVVDALIANRP